MELASEIHRPNLSFAKENIFEFSAKKPIAHSVTVKFRPNWKFINASVPGSLSLPLD
jgi:hypothetical protein